MDPESAAGPRKRGRKKGQKNRPSEVILAERRKRELARLERAKRRRGPKRAGETNIIYVYVDQGVGQGVEDLKHATGRTKQHIVETALREYLDREGFLGNPPPPTPPGERRAVRKVVDKSVLPPPPGHLGDEMTAEDDRGLTRVLLEDEE